MSTEKPMAKTTPTLPGEANWPKPPFTRPKTWADIDRGSLVIAFEDNENGWWEAVVVGKSAETYTLVFHDYAEQGEYVRNASQIALLKP